MISDVIRKHRERLGLSPDRTAELSQLSSARVIELECNELASKTTMNPKLLSMNCGGKRCVTVHDIPVSSEAAQMFATNLRPSAASATRNVGEDESIAFCAAIERAAAFVTADKTAAFVALAELGPGRVATPFDLWVGLKDAQLVSNELFVRLCERTAKHLNILPGTPWRLRG